MDKRENVVVFKGSIARELLRRGYVITDVKQNRDQPLASVFVFRNDEGLLKNLYELKEQQ